MTLAALPMYDLAELRDATDAFWGAVARRVGGPAELTRDGDLCEVWTSPDLLLAQTCGYPLVTALKGKVAMLATPRYTAPGCEGAYYRSAVIVRDGDPAGSLADLRGRRCAVNDAASNSGMNVLRAAIAPFANGEVRFFADVVMTGAHAASVAAVAGGRADVAAIDCITWAHLQHLRPASTAGLRVLTWTEATPGLPLITSVRTNAATRRALIQALIETAEDPGLQVVRAAVRLDGFEFLPLEAYDVVLGVEQRAIAAGYPILQ